MPTSFVLNGKNVTLDIDPNMPPLWAIWESAGLHGIKFSYGTAQCGVYTAQPNDTAVHSCVLSVPAVTSKYVATIEGTQSKSGKAVRDAWVKLQVPQYGYCQSGQIMPITVLLEQNASPSDADIDAAMGGNIYHCAVYVRIRIAIHEAADTLKI